MTLAIMLIGYGRASTNEPGTAAQVSALMHFVFRHASFPPNIWSTEIRFL